MKIVFYIYDPKKLVEENRAEIQFKSYIHNVYQTIQLHPASALEPQIYTESFTFGQESYVYYQFRDSKTGLTSDTKTVNVSSYTSSRTHQEIVLFVELKIEQQQAGFNTGFSYNSYSNTYYSSNNPYYYTKENYIYLSNFITKNITCELFRSILAFVIPLPFSFFNDRQNILKSLSNCLITKALPDKINGNGYPANYYGEIFEFLDLIEKEEKQAEAYAVCQILNKVLERTTNEKESQRAKRVIQETASYFKITDWIKEVNSKVSVTGRDWKSIVDILDSRTAVGRKLDTDTTAVMEEIMKWNGQGAEKVKSSIVYKCYQEQFSDLMKIRFLFKYSEVLLETIGLQLMMSEFTAFLQNNRRDKWSHRDMIRELSSNAHCFLRHFDKKGEFFKTIVTKKAFKDVLPETDQVTVLEAFTEADLSVKIYWKKNVVDAIKSHRYVDDIERICYLIIKIDPFLLFIGALKKYFMERARFVYVSIYEKMRMRNSISQILQHQLEVQRNTDDMIFDESNSQTPQDDGSSSEESLDDPYDDGWIGDDFYTNSYGGGYGMQYSSFKPQNQKQQTRGNRTTGNTAVAIPEKKLPSYETRRMTEEEVAELEKITSIEVVEIIKKLTTIDLVKDTKYLKKDEELYVGDAEKILEEEFGKSLPEEWNGRGNFKEKLDAVKKLQLDEVPFKRRIADMCLRKYANSAFVYYNSLKKDWPQHFQDKQIIDFLSEVDDLRDAQPFKETFSADFYAFINSHDQVSIQQLKLFLNSKNVERLFQLMRADFYSFQKKCLQTISMFDSQLEQLGELFRNFKEFFGEEQALFASEFNLEQKSGNVPNLISKYSRLIPFTEFNFSLCSSAIYQSLKRQLFVLKPFENEREAFRVLRFNLEGFARAFLNDPTIVVEKLQKYNFEPEILPQVVPPNPDIENPVQSEEVPQNQEVAQEQQQQQQQQQQPKPVKEPVQFYSTGINGALSIVDLKFYAGNSFDECYSSILLLLDTLEIKYNQRQVERQLFELFGVDFFRVCQSDISEILKQNTIDETDPRNTSTLSIISQITQINNYQRLSIWSIVKDEFKETLDCFRTVSRFGPKLIELLRRCDDIVAFSIENFGGGAEGRGFLDLNDIIDDSDADISSLIIKLNQLTPFINQLVQVRQQNYDAKTLLIELFSKIATFLKEENDQINLEDSLNNFFKIKNMSVNFDKKKSYIIISQQIVSEGKVRISFNAELARPSVEVSLTDSSYSEEEINQICSKVIIEQNTAHIIISQARRALIAKPKQSDGIVVEQDEEETILAELAAIRLKIDQFKEMWVRVGELKGLLMEISLLGYFDILDINLEYSNEKQSIDLNFAAMATDKHRLQNLLKDWQDRIREACSNYPLFSLIGHNLYSPMLSFVTQKSTFKDISADLQDILNLPVFYEQRKQFNSSSTDVSNLTPLQKLAKISSWFRQESSATSLDQANTQMEEEDIQKKHKVEAVFYSGNKELVDVFSLVFERQQNKKEPIQFYEYFYCDSLTQSQDVDLFVHRYRNLKQTQPRQFVVVLNSKLEATFTYRLVEALESLNSQSTNLFNKLLVLARREIYSEMLSNISSISVEDYLLAAANTDKKINEGRATFITSLLPGAGKSYQIQKIMNEWENKKNQVRIAISGSGKKSDIIELFRERLSQCDRSQPVQIHLDIYPIENYDLNMLLFELIAFGSLSIHQKSFVDVGNEVSFFIEVNNTLKNDLQDSLYVKDHFKQIQVKFSIEDYNPRIDIVGYQNNFLAGIVCHFLEQTLLAETEKDIFDRYEVPKWKKDQEAEDDGEGEGEGDGEGEEEGQGEEEDDEDEHNNEENQNREENMYDEVSMGSAGQSDHYGGSDLDQEEAQEEEKSNSSSSQNGQENRKSQPLQIDNIPQPNQPSINIEAQRLEAQRQADKLQVEREAFQHQQTEQEANKHENILDNLEFQQILPINHPDIEEKQHQPVLSMEQEQQPQGNLIRPREEQQNLEAQHPENYTQNQRRPSAIIEEMPQEQPIQQQIPVNQQNIISEVAVFEPLQIARPNESENLPIVQNESPIEQEQEINQPQEDLQQQEQEKEEIERQQLQEQLEREEMEEVRRIAAEEDQKEKEDSFFDMELLNMLPKEYKIEQLEFFQELLKKFFVDKLVSQGIEPCFHQLTNFINLFGSEMMKFEKCFFLEKSILYELEPQLLQAGLRTRVVELSLQLCFFISTNQTRPVATVIDPQNRNRREYILNEKAEKIQRFSELMTSFVTFQEQENPSLTAFFPTAGVIPNSIQMLYTIQGQANDLIHFDQVIPQAQLMKWLNMLINKHGDVIDHQVQEKVKRLAVQRDNFFKIAMIFMRIRALSPIVLMGEAGTGKTALIELLSALMNAKFFTMNIHAGVTEKEVVDFIKKSIQSIENEEQKVLVFFDEMNTSKLVEGIFKEVIVDRCLKGKKLPDFFVPITAINPYKLKSKEQKEMFSLQVHGGIKREVMSRMNNTDLEYMVEPLPESLYSFIWNIDHLSEEEEDQYIMKIVHFKNQTRQSKQKRHFDSEELRRIIAFLSYSQRFLRKIMGCQSACSLRDVARFSKLLFWFDDFLVKCKDQGLHLHQQQECAISLALSVNYCVRIPLHHQRKEYLKQILKSEQAVQDVDSVHSFLADQIEVPRGIVKNTAFKQNTLTLFASIMNKIPVILIGQPGCTKTLSLRLLIQSLRGDQSKSALFKSLKTLVPIYYQGHVQSTSERIMEVFTNANKKQQKIEQDNQQKRYLSMVYLEEIGLAEISPHNPLKVLHQTLEKPKVAVACISNWPLDQSKMNRMLSVYRLSTSKKELMETVHCIFDELVSSQKEETLRNVLTQISLSKSSSKYIVDIFKAYNTNLKTNLPEHEQFHGLRDFYGMAKLACSRYLEYLLTLLSEFVDVRNASAMENIEFTNLVKIDEEKIKAFIVESYLRHFSGLAPAFQYLEEAIGKVLFEKQPISSGVETEMEIEKEKEVIHTKSTWKAKQDELLMIDANLTEHSEYFLSRHLMIITHDTQKALEYVIDKIQNTPQQSLKKGNQPHQQAVKVFSGSDFVEDKASETSYQIINEIISCVESGVFVVLQNLDNVYQSLYELLNQNYHFYNGKYFCRVSLGADTSNVEVSPNFKLILIAHHLQIPCLSGPLLNRFEKHVFEQQMILKEEDVREIQEIENLIGGTGGSQSIFTFKNINQIVESVYLHHKRIGKEENQTGGQLSILQTLYHLASFKKVLFHSKDQELLSQYINSQLHFSLSDFITYRILASDLNADPTRGFCLFSSSAFTSWQEPLNFQGKTVTQQVIHLSEITSQVSLVDKLKEFFASKDLNNNNNSHSKISCEIEQNSEKIPILFVVCDMQEDSLERIIFTKQKIAENMQNRNIACQHRVIMTIKVVEDFVMIPFAGVGWEHYFIDELAPLQSIHCSEMKRQLDLKRILANQDTNFLQFFNIQPLIASFLRSAENISISYRKVRYSQDVMNYKTSRLSQLKSVLLNLQNSEHLQKLNLLTIKIVSTKFVYLLHSLEVKNIEDFIQKQVFRKGFVFQAASILKAIVSGLEDLLQQSLCFFIEMLEKQQLIFSLSTKFAEPEHFKILYSRILSSLDIQTETDLDSISSNIESNLNRHFIQRNQGSQLLPVSSDLLFPLDPNKVLLPLLAVIQQNLYHHNSLVEETTSSKSAVLSRVVPQVRELLPTEDISILITFQDYFIHDYFLTRSPEFLEQHSGILQELIVSSQDNQKVDQISIILLRLLCFELHSKAILKLQSFVFFYQSELSFKLKETAFRSFRPEDSLLQTHEMLRFTVFAILEVFQFLQDNMLLLGQKSSILSTCFERLLKFIDTQDLYRLKLNCIDRIAQTSKLILQFSQEIFDNGTRNVDIFRRIDFEEIRRLNIAYIHSLKLELCDILFVGNLALDEAILDDSKSNAIWRQREIQAAQLREKKLVQFEKSWCKCLIDLILSNVNDNSQMNDENQPLDSRLLKFIVDLEISMTSQKSENIQSIFKVVVAESFGHIKLKQMIQFYENEKISPTLPQKFENQEVFYYNDTLPTYHSEYFSLIALSELFQENIVRPAMSTLDGIDLLRLVVSEGFQDLSHVGKVIYFSVFREIIHQILKDDFLSLKKIFPDIQQRASAVNEITGFINNLSEKYFQLFILKQLYMICKSDMSATIQKSQFLRSPWIIDFTRSFKRLAQTDFLTSLEKQTFQRYFTQNKPLETAIKDLFWSDILFFRNVFREIYDGQMQQKYYPFMMFNNIQILFDRDPKNNMQLYQCQSCLEYIFSDQCPDLQSQHRCLQCGKQIALNNQNTKRVLQSACQNIAELHKIIHEDQWKGYYIVLEEDKPEFKLDEGSSFDLRLMALIYDTVILLSVTRNYRYFLERKENLLGWNDSVKEITVKEINKQLKIHYEADAQQHLQDQIQISLKHIKHHLVTFHKMKDEDVPIILFKFLQLLTADLEIKACETPQERTAMNIRISESIKKVFTNLTQLSQVEHSFAEQILEQQEQLGLASNYKRNLRYFDMNYQLANLSLQLNEQIPNNEFQVLKKLLNFSEVNQISQMLQVFVNFYKLINKAFSNRYSLKKAQDVSFIQAIQNNRDDALYVFYLQEFIPAWDQLRLREKVFQIECESPEIPVFDENTKLNYLVFSENKNIASFTNGLELVCKLQNNYIHHIYQLSVIDAIESKVDSKLSQQVKSLFESGEEGKSLKQHPLDQIDSSVHVVKAYDETILKNYVFPNLEYGQGRKYVFDLEQLQRRLVREVLTGAVLIDLEKSVRFKYLNEMHQIGLLQNNLIPQETIFFEIRSRIQKHFSSKEQAFEFLQQLSTLFQMFKAEYLQGELSIKSALDTLQLKLKHDNLKEILSEQLKLKHLNDLICCIEEIQLDNLVELCNPFYKLPIEPEAAISVADFIRQNGILLSDFILALGRFTIRCLSSDASSISPHANLFEQVFYSEIYSELWRDPSKLDKIYPAACKVKTLIGQSYSLFQFLQKQKGQLQEPILGKEMSQKDQPQLPPSIFL